MTAMYGSKAKPVEIFGEDTPEYQAFYQVLEEKCNGPYTLLRVLVDAWNPSKTYNHWVLPDGYNAYVPAMVSTIDRVKIEELNYTMSVQTWVNQPLKYSVSLAANVIHSVDAYVLRTLVRRCNYSTYHAKRAVNALLRVLETRYECLEHIEDKAVMPIHLYLKTGIADIICMPDIPDIAHQLPRDMCENLLKTIQQMLKHEPFELITIHDSFACHPNNCNVLRYWYKETLADLADSTILDSLLSQIMEEDCVFTKNTEGLGNVIRQSNYGLC